VHTSVLVCGRGGRVDRSVVGGFGLGRWDAAEAVHEPLRVVPVHPGCGDLLQVGEGGNRPMAERGAVADALGLVQTDRGLGQGVVQRVCDGADRGRQTFQEQRLSEVDRRILAARIRIKPKSA
jgi:hypothetical protein